MYCNYICKICKHNPVCIRTQCCQYSVNVICMGDYLLNFYLLQMYVCVFSSCLLLRRLLSGRGLEYYPDSRVDELLFLMLLRSAVMWCFYFKHLPILRAFSRCVFQVIADWVYNAKDETKNRTYSRSMDITMLLETSGRVRN